jgi:uncharacterized NAD(P)/FAD-binding protein YdhS
VLHRPPAEPRRIVLMERREQIGRGVAYPASQYRLLLNVPAERMSADPDDPLQFARSVQAQLRIHAYRRADTLTQINA